jgi:hypothetical protein
VQCRFACCRTKAAGNAPVLNPATGADLIVFARKIHVEVLGQGETRDCPANWLDSFCMRSFTGRSTFDDLLPVSAGLIEAGSRVDLQFLRVDLEDWFTRKFGGGSQVKIRLTELRPEVDSKSQG